MKTVSVQPLSVEKFHRYGSYAALIDPCADATGPKDAPIVFFRDMVQQELFGSNPSFSTCRMTARPLVIDVGEYHNRACEVSMPLDNDALVWVAAAGAEADRVPVERIEVFYVPKGTLLMLRPGVWHHAAFSVNRKPVNVMIVLPEREYMTDCICAQIPKTEQVRIRFPEKKA
ncbi:MAG: ureidoglycolate lyase [Lentisphaeria bacterium]|nr:ureidoglycolate lyase [Lentisphaeria bacterium]